MSTTSRTAIPATGELRWNIKQSFRDYVAELPDGVEAWTSEMGSTTDGDLVFPVVEMIVTEDSVLTPIFKFAGSIQFVGYGGMLRVDLRDPWLEVGEELTTISADSAPSGVPPRRTPIATLEGGPAPTEEGAWVWRTESTLLTVAGAALLGSVYPPGAEAAGFQLHVLPA